MTSDEDNYKELALSILAAAQRAGAAIMDIYGPGMSVRYKADASPVTDADHASEEILLTEIGKLMPGVPVISEEQAAAGNLPEAGSTYFAVDPLDGTKEFLKLNGEFAISIGLISGRKAIFGLVFGPAKADCFVTLAPGQAFRCVLHPAHDPAPQRNLEFAPLNGEAAGRPLTAIISRSHLAPETAAFLEAQGNPEKLTMGSALKFGMLAAGEGDFYPRHGATSEWDTAGGQAILEAAGGAVLTLEGEPLLYGKKGQSFRNPPFIAWRRRPENPS